MIPPTVAEIDTTVAEVPPCPDRPVFRFIVLLEHRHAVGDRSHGSRLPPRQAGKQKGKPLTERAILFACRRHAAGQGGPVRGPGRRCPRSSSLIRDGVKGTNGLVQAFPPNTGVGWHTLGDRHLAGRARLDQQHLSPDR